MSGLSLGLIETVGLAAAFEAADTCVKSANVKLVGYELTKGDGMAVIKIEGDVGAVKAAIEAARMSAGKVNKVVSTKIIPRPSTQIDIMIKNSHTVGLEKEDVDKEEEIIEEIKVEAEQETQETEQEVQTETEQEVQTETEQEVCEAEVISIVDDINDAYTCNICKDPKCPRGKGDFRKVCIHYKK